MHLCRHDLVYLDQAQWPAILAGYPAAMAIPAVVEWVQARRPLVLRRPVCADTGHKVALGLPLPPSLGKLRIAVEAPFDAVVSVSPPHLASRAIQAAPSAWKPPLGARVLLDPNTRLFGSLSWAALTGLDYLSKTSDLDLLWHVETMAAADALLPHIIAIDARAPMRLDGEFVTPDGMAVQWREWASDAAEIMVKTAQGVHMMRRDEVPC